MSRQGAHSRRPGVVLLRAANRGADLADLCPARRWRVYTKGGKYSAFCAERLTLAPAELSPSVTAFVPA
jgi:hypothetical protein